jgi:hypothetical protein
VRRHRSRLHYELQYAFLSGCSAPGSIPLWLPFASQGVPSNPALFTQAGLLQSALMLAGPAWQGADFQPLFFLGLFLEELLFLVGCWMLARRLFPSPYTAFFVGVSALGSAFWLDQVELNFHSIYAVPLVLEFAQRAFLQKSLKHHLLTGNLLWIQMLGSPPGAGLACAFAPLIFFSARAFVLREPFRNLFQTAAEPRRAAAVQLGMATGIPVVLTAVLGAGVFSGPTSFPSPHDILVYAGLSNPLRYAEFLLGVMPSLDWTLYCGALNLGFGLVALRMLPRSTVLRLLLAVVAGMLVLGVVLFGIFFLVPAFRPASPLPYATPFARLFVVFLAGAGFQQVLDARPTPALRFAGRLLLAGAFLLALLSWNSIRRPELTHDLLTLLVNDETASAAASPVLEPWIYPDQLRVSLVADLLGASCLFATLAGGLLLLLGGRSRAAPLALTLVLVVHPLDAFSWKFRMSWLETFPANAVQRGLQRLSGAPFAPRRLASVVDAPRYREFHRISAEETNPNYAPRAPDGGAENAYWQADVDGSPGATTGDKIRFSAGDPSGRSEAATLAKQLPLTPVVEAFDPNALRLRVESVPPGTWLSYADTWNPAWTATVNGAPRSIARGRLQGKELPLDAGTNVVEFRYSSPIRTLSFFLVALNSLAWLLWTLRTAFLLALRGGVEA